MYIFCSCCFSGLMNRDYETLLNNSPSTISHYNGTGTAMSIAANRISYTFNLTGPSFAIDSACSSSLVAVHSACQAIRQGKTSLALKYHKATSLLEKICMSAHLLELINNKKLWTLNKVLSVVMSSTTKLFIVYKTLCVCVCGCVIHI